MPQQHLFTNNHNKLKKGSIASTAHNFYPGDRHEMLHEMNRREVFADLLVWISGVLEQASAR